MFQEKEVAKREKELNKEAAAFSKQAGDVAKRSEQVAQQEEEVGRGPSARASVAFLESELRTRGSRKRIALLHSPMPADSKQPCIEHRWPQSSFENRHALVKAWLLLSLYLFP